jgi:hypothetical protein
MYRQIAVWFGVGTLVLTVMIGPATSSRSRAPQERRAAAPTDHLAPLPAPLTVLPTSTSAPAAAAEPQQGNVVDQATPTRTPTPINIGNFVWDDLDKDGRQDAGEPGLPNVTVQLWNSTKTALLDSAVTSASGIYTVTAPLPGDYRVRVLLPSALDTFSPKDAAGGDDQLDSDINPSGVNLGFTDVFTLAPNVISTTIYDAGIIVYRPPTPTRTPTPINVGNFVWHDLNSNGIQDAGEPGVGGVTVQLWNAAKTFLYDQEQTNSNGNYSLTAPLPGDYRVRVLLPTGASFSINNAGANDQVDSDVNPSGINFGFTDPYTFGSNLISITTIDAGLINVQPSPTPSQTMTPTRTPTATATGTAMLPRKAYLPLATR